VIHSIAAAFEKLARLESVAKSCGQRLAVFTLTANACQDFGHDTEYSVSQSTISDSTARPRWRLLSAPTRPTMPINTMTNEPNDERLQRIEAKLRLLVVLAIVQTSAIAILITSMLANQFMPSIPTLILVSAIIGASLYVFRSKIPLWFGSISRFVFSHLLTTKKNDTSNDSKKF
jgi:hypothetical protein